MSNKPGPWFRVQGMITWDQTADWIQNLQNQLAQAEAELDKLKAELSVIVDRIAAKELSRERIFRAMRDNLYFAGRADEALFVHGPLLRALCEKGGGKDG